MKYLIHMVIKMTTFKTNILPKQTSTLGEVWCDPVQIFTKLYNYLKKKKSSPPKTTVHTRLSFWYNQVVLRFKCMILHKHREWLIVYKWKLFVYFPGSYRLTLSTDIRHL